MSKSTTKPVKQKRTLSGEVVSDRMRQTVVVKVSRLKTHPKYKNRYQVSRRLKAHDEKEECHIGDQVVIEAVRPLSKEKKWKVKKIVRAVNNQQKDDSTADNIESN